MQHYKVGCFSELAGINIETVRFYEKRGLMPEPKRSESGYRYYDSRDLERMMFILRAKKLGFTLKEIQELLSLRVDPDCSCETIREKAEQKIHEIEEKIRDLRRFNNALHSLVKICVERGSSSECPILDALQKGMTDNEI